MATTPNGRHNGYVSHPSHRFDDVSELVFRKPSSAEPVDDGGGDRSGRRFVVIAILVLAALWAVLFLVFREWRARYFVRAAFGASQVAPVIDGLEKIEPPGVSRVDWLDAVHRTRALVLTVTDSNLLSIDQMKALRAELSQNVDRARERPETALDELAAVWNSLAARAAFLFRDTRRTDGVRHIRPAILPPPPKQP